MRINSINRFTAGLSNKNLVLHFYPDQVLTKNSNPVRTFDTALQEFVEKMYNFMQIHQGIGLAAPQLGVLFRIITIDTGNQNKFLINPEIITASSDNDTLQEGCLSIPGEWFDINRSLKIEVRARSPEGKKLHFEAQGMNARVIQHEIDHLNGILICDKFSRSGKDINGKESYKRSLE